MERITWEQAVQKDSLSLALVGDGVWSLYVRGRLCLKHDYKSGVLSKECVKFVNAGAQCKILYAIENELTKDESDVCRRARNAHNYSRAKNATLDEYKKATALEALFGCLYLTGQSERLTVLMDKSFKVIYES